MNTPNIKQLREWISLFDQFKDLKIQRILNQPSTWAIASIILFGSGVGVAAYEWNSGVRYSKTAGDQIKRVMEAEHPYNRNKGNIGVTSLLLANANKEDISTAPITDLPSEWQYLFETFRREYKKEKEQINNPSSSHQFPSITPCADSSDLSLYTKLHRPYRLDNEGRTANDYLYTLENFSLGPAGCITSDGNISSHIPSSITISKWKPDDDTDFSKTTTITDIQSIDIQYTLAAHKALSTINQHSSFKLDRIKSSTQVFFIDVFGSITLWSKSSTALQELWRKPLNKYGVSTYFQHYLNRPNFTNQQKYTMTGVYLDFLGSGLVRTVCIPVYNKEPTKNIKGKSQKYINIGPGFNGVLCVDITPPIQHDTRTSNKEEPKNKNIAETKSDIYTPISLKNNLLNINLYCESSGIISEFKNNECIKIKTIYSAEHTITKDIITKTLEESSLKTFKIRDYSDAPKAVLLQKIEIDGIKYRIVAVITPNLFEPDVLLIALSGIFFLLAAATSAMAAKRSQQNKSNQTLLELLRNLPAGVTMIDNNSNIIFANDRAEEIFQAPLPTTPNEFNEEYVSKERFDRFLDLTDGILVGELQDDGSHNAAQDMPSYEWKYIKEHEYQSEIKKLRNQGLPYTYVAKLRQKHGKSKFVIIYATPFLKNSLFRSSDSIQSGEKSEYWMSFGVFSEFISIDPKKLSLIGYEK